jgi:cytochrome c oxidase assembly protein subunit 15
MGLTGDQTVPSSATAVLKPADQATAARPKRGIGAVASWLFACCTLTFLMVVVGGITRLTLSGLSITEWKPIVGLLPPLSPAEWAGEFAKYKEIPEYRLVHYAMSLDEFKTIYFWEYLHRLLGRLVGIAYGVPFVWFLARRQLPRSLVLPLAGILLLGFGQGALGWYMVESGLADRTEVSQYRLVAHLLLALAIYATMLWVALGIVGSRPRPEQKTPLAGLDPAIHVCNAAGKDVGGRAEHGHGAALVRSVGETLPSWRRAGEAIVVLVALTIAAGGLVAGTHAGLTYNTFPLMDGHMVPADYAQLHPFFLNWFENVAAIQFNHRALALATAALVLLVWVAGLRGTLPISARLALHALLATVALQVVLGVATLLLVVPIPLAAAHQAMAVLLLTAAIVLRHTLRRTGIVDAKTPTTI